MNSELDSLQYYMQFDTSDVGVWILMEKIN